MNTIADRLDKLPPFTFPDYSSDDALVAASFIMGFTSTVSVKDLNNDPMNLDIQNDCKLIIMGAGISSRKQKYIEW